MKELKTIHLLRIKDIVGDPKATPPIRGLLPIGKSTWWQGIKEGRFPKGRKLSRRITVWRSDVINKIIEQDYS